MNVNRRSSKALAPLAVGTAAMVASVALGAATPIAGAMTTSSVLSSAKKAIAKQTGVHLVLSAKSKTSSTETLIADLGGKTGSETITEGKASVKVKVTAKFGYISGNSSGLTTIFGLTAAEAKKLGKSWMSLKASTSQYSQLKSDVTVASVKGVLPAAKGTKLSKTSRKGARLYVLKWTTAATSSAPKLSSSLTVRASGAALPLEETASSSSGTKETADFTKWGERVVVTPPPAKSTIASTKVTG